MRRAAPKSLADIAANAEREAIRTALIAESGAVTRTAARLRVSVATLKRKLALLGLAEWNRKAHPLSARQPKR